MSKKLSNLMLSTQNNIIINTELAVKIGLNEAIVLRQIYYWLEINEKIGRNFHDGKYWTYNTISSWQKENFPFWSEKTVERAFKSLTNSGIVITANYNKDPRDRTKWYSIDENVLEKTINEIVQSGTEETCEQTDCSFANRQNDGMDTDNVTEALPENNYREYHTEIIATHSIDKKDNQFNAVGSDIYNTNNNINNTPNSHPENKEKEHAGEIAQSETRRLNTDDEIAALIATHFFDKYIHVKKASHPEVSSNDFKQINQTICIMTSILDRAGIDTANRLIDFYGIMIDEYFAPLLEQDDGVGHDCSVQNFFTMEMQITLYNKAKERMEQIFAKSGGEL